jgi:hypothetical protein
MAGREIRIKIPDHLPEGSKIILVVDENNVPVDVIIQHPPRERPPELTEGRMLLLALLFIAGVIVLWAFWQTGEEHKRKH